VDVIPDHDSEALERLLDDDLSPAEAEVLRRRLSSEPALAAALDQVEAERASRRDVWRSLEPTDAEAAGVESRFQSAVRRQERADGLRNRLTRFTRVAAAAAACAALFLAGWFARARVAPPAGVADRLAAPTPSALVRHAGTSEAAGSSFHVVLTDQAGAVIATQQFERMDEAREFADDLARMQAEQRAVQRNEVMLISDEF
jgi:anti-sigma factor RsiW